MVILLLVFHPKRNTTTNTTNTTNNENDNYNNNIYLKKVAQIDIHIYI